MASAGSITWDLIANSSQFVTELEKANKAGKNWGDKLGKAAKGVALTFAAVGTAAATGLAALYTVTAGNIDEQSKFADKIGVTTQALGGLQHAGDLTGVSTENMNLGLQRMTRRVAEAAKGTGTAVDALDALNISAEDLNQLSPDEQFLAIADAMGEVEGRSEQVRLAFKLFDSGGVALLNTMDMASDGIREAMEQAEHLGIALNRVDAAQVENANDAFDNMTKVSAGISRQLTVAFAPAVEAVSHKMLELALETEWIGEVGTKVFNAVVLSAGLFADALYILVLRSVAVRAAMMELAAVAAESMTSSAETVAIVLNATVGNLGKLIQWITDQLSSLVALGSGLPGQVGKWAGEASVILDDLGQQVNKSLQFDSDNVVEGIEAMRDAANDAYDDFERLANAEMPSETVAKTVEEWQRLSRAEAEAAANAKVYNDIISDTTAINRLASVVGTNSATMEQATKRWGDSFTNTMADVVTKGEISFTNLAESIINDLIRIAIQANITDQILNSFGFGGSAGGGSGGGSPDGMARGGPVERGTTYLVGEDGPELFTASNSGNIIPNYQLNRAGIEQATSVAAPELPVPDIKTLSRELDRLNQRQLVNLEQAFEPYFERLDSDSGLTVRPEPERPNKNSDAPVTEEPVAVNRLQRLIVDSLARMPTRQPEGTTALERGATYEVNNASARSGNETMSEPPAPVVNIYTQPGETAETNTRSGPEGDIIEIFMKQVDSRMNEQVSRGQGLARTLEGRYGLTRKAY